MADARKMIKAHGEEYSVAFVELAIKTARKQMKPRQGRHSELSLHRTVPHGDVFCSLSEPNLCPWTIF